MQIGKPIMSRVYAPDVLKMFSGIDHAGYARDMEKFFLKVEAAAKDAGLSQKSHRNSMSWSSAAGRI